MEKQILISMSLEEFQAVINQVMRDALKSLNYKEEKSKEASQELLSRSEAADFLKITLVTLSQWTKRGLIKASYLGGRVYYFKNDLIKAFN